MAIQVVGSHMRTDAFYGQNGSAQPSSIRPGDPPIKRSEVAQSIVEANHAKVPAPNAPDWQTRTVSAKPIKASPTMKNPNASPAKIPDRLSRGLGPGARPSSVPAAKGNAKR